MPTTIAASFEGLKRNLEITALQQSTVSTRQKSVRDAVARRLKVLDSFVTGSYGRHTMIAPLASADVDIFVVLDPSYYEANGYASLLDRVRRALLETYTKSPRVSRNGQAVTITFTDFVVDVVPAFHRKGGGYLIPNTVEQRWISTNPKTHETFMSRANGAHRSDLVPLVKMIKGWNREHGAALHSFYLELLVEKVLRGVTITDFPSGARYVFDKGRDAVKYKIDDPAGLGSKVNGIATGTVAQAVGRFQTALSQAQEAERQASGGNVRAAVAEWRKVFGTYFPAYG